MKLYLYNGRCNQAGENIRKVREEMGLSQEQLAAKLQLNDLEITQKSISRIETGLRVIPDFELPHFANVLGKTIEQLLET